MKWFNYKIKPKTVLKIYRGCRQQVLLDWQCLWPSLFCCNHHHMYLHIIWVVAVNSLSLPPLRQSNWFLWFLSKSTIKNVLASVYADTSRTNCKCPLDSSLYNDGCNIRFCIQLALVHQIWCSQRDYIGLLVDALTLWDVLMDGVLGNPGKYNN